MARGFRVRLALDPLPIGLSPLTGDGPDSALDRLNSDVRDEHHNEGTSGGPEGRRDFANVTGNLARERVRVRRLSQRGHSRANSGKTKTEIFTNLMHCIHLLSILCQSQVI